MDGERILLACFGGFLGFVTAFAITPVLGGFVNYEPAPQLWWAGVTMPLFTIIGFTIVWKATKE